MRWNASLRGVVVLGLVWMVTGCSSDDAADRGASREEPAPSVESASESASTSGGASSGESAREHEAVESSHGSTASPATSQSAEDVAVPPAEPTQEPKSASPPTREESPEPAAPSTPQTETAAPPDTQQPEQEETTPAALEAATSAEGDPGGVVAVPATKSGLTYIGAAKCKMCHKVQYASWEASAHAARVPSLDCESCHGPGSEYKKLSIMKDPALAKAADLVMPEKSFCMACHQGDWQDDMLVRSHAHKGDAP